MSYLCLAVWSRHAAQCLDNRSHRPQGGTVALLTHCATFFVIGDSELFLDKFVHLYTEKESFRLSHSSKAPCAFMKLSSFPLLIMQLVGIELADGVSLQLAVELNSAPSATPVLDSPGCVRISCNLVLMDLIEAVFILCMQLFTQTLQLYSTILVL